MARFPEQTPEAVREELQRLRAEMHQRRRTAIGIPTNLAASYADVLRELSDVFLNNIGDVFVERKRSFSTQVYERRVLEYFAGFYGLGADDWWGYTTPGSTEGNLSGLWLARERFPQATLFYSADSHYSLNKIARLLRMDSRVVPTQPNGEMDYAEFDRLLERRDAVPVIISLNIGSTMKGAIDDLDGVTALLSKHRVSDFHIHCDAALFGGYLPFLDDGPRLGFEQSIDSLAISGYKFIGSPFPCGLMLTRKHLADFIRRNVEYICSPDTTLSGSRNGHAPLVLWHALATRDLRAEAQGCIERAARFQRRLADLPYPCFRNEHSNIIMLKRPSPPLVERWRLVSEGDWSHVIVMQHVTDDLFEEFLTELKQEL